MLNPQTQDYLIDYRPMTDPPPPAAGPSSCQQKPPPSATTLAPS